jgi:hypothetical protein
VTSADMMQLDLCATYMDSRFRGERDSGSAGRGIACHGRTSILVAQ